MSIAERRARDRKARRDSIVDAAEKLFFTKGFAATTIDEIAEAAELSKGTIYLYFKNKEEIYISITQRGVHFLMEMSREAVASASNGRQKVRALSLALLRFYERHPNHFKALFFRVEGASGPCPAMDHKDPLITALLHDKEELYAFTVEAFRSGIADGSINTDVDPIKATLVLVGMILGLVRMVAVEEKFLLERFHVSGEDLIQAAFDLMGRPMEDAPKRKPAEGP